MSRRVYKQPPIREALCEFGFLNFPSWDPARIGRFYGGICDVLDGTPDQDLLFQAAAVGDGLQPAPPLLRSRFPAKDGRKVAMVSGTAVSAHVLAPYGGWLEDFKPFAEKVAQAFWKAAPNALCQRVQIRYINNIDLPVEGLKVGDYLVNAPLIPEGLPTSVISVIHQTKIYDETEDAVISLTLGNQPSHTEWVSFVLDIAVTHEFDEPASRFDEVLLKLDSLRNLERSAFEACITDQLREKLDE